MKPINSDSWETPKCLFMELKKEFNIEIDLCATVNNSKCILWCDDYLQNQLHGYKKGSLSDLFRIFKKITRGAAFMNPPYSNPLPFVKKAWDDSKYCKIVCLLKCDTSTRTFGVFWDYVNHKPKEGAEIRFLPKRIKFEINGVAPKNGPTFPSVIVIMDRRHEV